MPSPSTPATKPPRPFAATLTYAGRPSEGIGFMERAMRLTPYYPFHYLLRLGRAYRLVGREEEAITTLGRAKERMEARAKAIRAKSE